MAEGRNSRKRLLSDLEVDSQLIPPFQKSRISNEETTVCVPAATSGASSSNHHSSIIQWIWTLVKRPFSYVVEPIQLDNSPPSSSSFIPSTSTAIPAAPSPTGPTRWKYDVFLSFRGLDTRKGITSAIRDGLQRRGVRTFMDDQDLHVGDTISPTLIAAIEASHFAVVILSKNYASSTWCLEELVKICECMANEERIFPLFYHVDPTDVRYQKNGNFKEAFSKHETSNRHEPETVKKWRAALKQVADKSGWSSDAFKTDRELVDKIVETLGSKVVPNTIESIGDFHAYEATTKAMNEVKEALRDQNMTAVGVYGMGGVGKTTMVTQVAAEACRNGMFNRWIIVIMSQNPNFNQIQLRLSDFLGVQLGEQTEDGRAAKLHKEIMRSEKLLIILDDVWDELDLSKIGIPNFNELQKCSSKVLMTTRKSHVCFVMECQRKIILECLSEQDSWTLFVRKARRSFESPTFEGVARKVARECKGLPIALISVARALGDKDLAEWTRAAQRLANSQSANPDDNGKASECIRLSYDHLKNEYKSFFLLCCLFPEDHKINIEDLFRYAIGKGLFRDAETLEEARKDAKIWVGYLQDSCLLLGQDGTNIKMHDVVRDAAVQIAQSGEHNFFVKAGCGLKHWPHQIHEDYTVISLMDNDIRKLPDNLVCPKLQILLLNENYCINEIPETFFKSLKDLRVLDLSYAPGDEYLYFSLLPQSISLLTNLTFLSLLGSHKVTCETSTLGKLKKLEILYLLNIHLEELSIELGGLTNLRIFSCDDKSIKRIPPGVISEWKNLEELHMIGFGEWRCEMEGEEEETINAGFEEVTSLSKLRVIKATVFHTKALPTHVDLVPDWVEFNITIGDSFKDGDENLRSHSIEIYLDNISELPKWFRDGLMKKAELLHWEGCKNLSDIFVDLEHQRLLKLRHLYLKGLIHYDRFSNDEIEQSSSGKMGESFTQDEFHKNPTRIPVLENLEKLSLMWIDHEKLLEAVQTLPPGSLANLKELDVIGAEVILTDVNSDLTEGNTLLPSATLKILSNLEKISISWTKQRYIFGHDVLVVSLPLNIREIRLDICSMIGICEGRAPPTIFQNLQTLEICSCDELEGSLFTHEVAQCLPQLVSLSLRRCELLERIVEAGNNKTILPKLRKLSLHYCSELYCQRGSLDIECPSLEIFKLSDCPKFVSLQRNTRWIKLFQNLQSLDISKCNELKGSLFTHEIAQCLPQLDSLSLDRCELLERIVEAGNNKTILPKLRKLSLRGCPVLYCERGNLDIECPSLEFFKLSDCPKFVSLPRNIRTIQLSSGSIISICEGRAPPTMFQNLQSLDISYCNQLEGSLFTHEVSQCLPHLDSLSLYQCELLERIVEAGNNKTILPKLRNLSLWYCPVLYCERGSLDIECPSLEMFYLINCPKFAASFDDFNSRKQQKA